MKQELRELRQAFEKEIGKTVQLQNETRLAKERLEFLLSQSPAIIYTANPKCEFETTFISKNLEAIHGYSSEEYYRYPHFRMSIAESQDIDEVIKWAENIEEAAKQINKSLAEKGWFEVEYRLRNQDGSYSWIQDWGRLIYDEAQNVLELIGCMIDITEQKLDREELNRHRLHLEELVKARTAELEKKVIEHGRAEKSLRESEGHYRILAENVADGVGILRDRKLVFVNTAFADLLAYPKERLNGKDLSDFIAEDYRQDFEKVFLDLKPELESKKTGKTVPRAASDENSDCRR